MAAKWYHPAHFDVEEFAAAFIRFDSRATIILEVGWLLHHETAEPEHADGVVRHRSQLALAQK